MIGIDNNKCEECLNWDIEKGRYSKELVKGIGGFPKKNQDKHKNSKV